MIIQTEKIRKTFLASHKGKKQRVEAVKSVTLEVKKGEIFGFLGPNGAGKSTTMDILTTLSKPTEGKAKVAGFDLLTRPEKVREKIGYVSQAGGADPEFNCYENLILQCTLYGMERIEAMKSTEKMISKFKLKDFADRKVKEYSGGQKRRLELALGVVSEPDIVFLDEPTAGLDPQSRAYFWEEIKKLQKEGMTIFITTHYLEEADNLCDRVAIIDNGSIVEIGSPESMKKNLGNNKLTLDFFTQEEASQYKKKFVERNFSSEIEILNSTLSLSLKDEFETLAEIVNFIKSLGTKINSINITKPTLDDVFLKKTGKSLRDSL